MDSSPEDPILSKLDWAKDSGISQLETKLKLCERRYGDEVDLATFVESLTKLDELRRTAAERKGPR